MRWLMTMAVMALGVPAWAQESEAEKLYRALEKQVRSAKGLKVVFVVDSDLGKTTMTAKGFMVVAQGNKGRMEFQGKGLDGKEYSVLMLADGKESAEIEGGKVLGKPRPVEPTLTEAALALTVRGGVFAVLETSPDPDNKAKFDVDKVLPASDFTLGKKEKVGDREAQVILFNVTPPKRPSVQVTLWLDTKTNLPLKRTLMGSADGNKISVSEAYSEFSIDPTFDAKMFELPK